MMKQSLINKLALLFSNSRNFDSEGLEVSFDAGLSATDAELHLLTSRAAITIPQDYLDFLRNYNGCTLFKFEDIGGFELLGTAQIEKENELQRNTYGTVLTGDILKPQLQK